MLHKFYNSKDKVTQLLELGNISALKENINPSTKSHSFDFPEENVTIAYSRDRGEPNNEAKTDTNVKDYRERLMDNWYDYAYLFDEKNDKWLFLNILELQYGDKLESENFLDNFTSLENELDEISKNHPEDLLLEL